MLRPALASRLVFLTPPKPVTRQQRDTPVAGARQARRPFHAEVLPASASAPAVVMGTELPPLPPTEPLPTAADIMAQARRDLRKIDKEILGSGKAVPAQRPDSMQARLARGIENAFVGATTEVTDHYTAADGVVYSRVTRGGHATCFMNGASTLAAATRSGGKWTQVNCPPPDSGWTR